MTLGATPMTLSMWVYLYNVERDMYLFSVRDTSPPYYSHFLGIDYIAFGPPKEWQFQFGVRATTSQMHRRSTAAPCTIGIWQHCLITWAGDVTDYTGVKLWVNGSDLSDTGADGVGSVKTGESYWSIGGRHVDDTLNFDGKLAECGFWNRILADDEIIALSQGYSPRFFPNELKWAPPLIRSGNDPISGIAGSMHGSTATVHNIPGLIYPYSCSPVPWYPVTKFISGTIDAVSSVSNARFSRSVKVAGTIAVNSTVSATLLRCVYMPLVPIVCQSLISLSPLSVTKEIAGTFAVQSAISGTLGIDKFLNGTLAATSAISGSLKIIREVSRTTILKSTITGNLATTGLVGSFAAQSAVTGTLKVTRELIGTIDASSTVSGELTVSLIGLPIACSSVISGSLSVSQKLVGTFAATSAVTGLIRTTMELQSTITASGTLSGAIKTICKLTATITTQSNLTGLLIRVSIETLSGAISCSSTIGGPLTVSRELIATISAQSTIGGPLKVTRELVSTITVASTISGTLINQLFIIGTITVQSTTVGALSVKRGLIVVVAATGGVSGSLSVLRKLVGSIAAQSNITGVMPVFALPSFLIVSTVNVHPILTSAIRVNARLKSDVVSL